LAQANLAAHGADNAKVLKCNAMDAGEVAACADLSGPFDVLVIATAVDAVPQHLLERLAEEGQVLAFVGSGSVVEMVHQQFVEGGAVRSSTVMETELKGVEGVASSREFVF